MQVFKLYEMNAGAIEASPDHLRVQYAMEHAAASLRNAGLVLERIRFLEQPQAFLSDPDAVALMDQQGDEAFPLLKQGETVLKSGAYPTAEEWVKWTGLEAQHFPEQFSDTELQLWWDLTQGAQGCGGSCGGCSGCGSGGCSPADDLTSEDWGDLT